MGRSLRIADIVRAHGPAYMERFVESMLPSHARAMRAIANCRTPALGGHLGECAQCGQRHLLYHSCRHRACPQCGHDSTAKWLAAQRELLLPVRYFHVVFTLPAELRRLVRSHQEVLFGVLFRAAFETLSTLWADPKHLGAAQIGALAVLHTWTRTLEWHPHIHMLVPAGGLDADGRTWRSVSRRRKLFLVPVRALAKHFRGRFLALARSALPGVAFPEIPWDKPWVVYAKPTVQGADKLLAYLGRYVHRTATSDEAVAAMDETTVTFTYRDSRDHQRKSMRLPAHEYLRRLLQHVPPKGLHRVRSFGLLHPAHRDTLRRLQLLLAPRAAPPIPPTPPATKPRLRCPHCAQGTLRLVLRLSAAECTALAATASAADAAATLRASVAAPGARAPPATSPGTAR